MPVPENEILRRQRMERLPRVSALYVQGHTVREIAALTGVTPRVTYKDIEILEKRWIKRVRGSTEKYIALELARLNLAERSAWASFERSIKGTEEHAETSAGKRVISSRRRRTNHGDMACLAMVLKCHEARCKLLRLHDVDESDTNGELRARVVEIVVDTPEQVAQILSYQEYEDARVKAIEGPPADGSEP